MEPIRLYRRRYVPDEMVELKDDKILLKTDDMIVTKWDILKPRKDIDHGISIYYIEKGFKISKVYDAGHQLVYWYCDIIHTEFDEDTYSYIFHDLLIDVLIHPDNRVEVVDLDEFAEFTEKQLLSADLLGKALHQTDDLLQYIYHGKFDELIQPMTEFDKM